MANKRSVFFYATLANVVLIIYGSLVPFEIRPHSLAQAWEYFRHIRYLKLGIVSRADWIANIVLYIPFAFFASAWLASDQRYFSRRFARRLLVFITGVMLAVAVEFSQIWFAPRTVSLNDIIAEIIGSALGIVFWEMAGDRVIDLARKIIAGGPPAVKAIATFYVIGYVAFSLFPYDFIVTPRELAWKLGTGRAHLIMAHCGSTFFCLSNLLAEILAVLPLGVWVGMHYKQDRTRTMRIALRLGLGLGVIVELAQFFLASGVSQGISVVARAAGVMVGTSLYQHVTWQRVNKVARFFRPMIIVGSIPYAAALLTLNGWFSAPWIGLHEALERLAHTHFLPFYYHYFSTETVALVSLIRQVAMYLPLGVAYWAWWWQESETAVSQRAWHAAGIGALAATGVSIGKLFVPDKLLDPTDVLIAAAAAGLGYVLAVWIRRWSSGDSISIGAEVPATPPLPVPKSFVLAIGQVGFMRRLFAGLIGLVVAIVAVQYPLHASWLCLALLVYAFLLWRRPSVWLLVLPAILPVLNFAPWTGWFFFDEFDLFVLVTLAVGLLRTPVKLSEIVIPRLALVLVGLLATSFAISLLVGLFPLSPLDANAFFNYMSHYNALRVVKGFVWALALWPLLRRADGNPAARFITGMVVGLSGVVAALIWERFLYAGLFDFHAVYRITATFFSMHTGGPQIEAYLIFALPFVVAWSLARRTIWTTVLAIALFAGGSYGVLVTYSRGGYLALVVILTIMAGSVFMRLGLGRQAVVRRTAVFGVITLITVLIAIPVLWGGFAESRFERVGSGVEARLQHWHAALEMMDKGPITTLFGMGLGRFPETYRNRNTRDVLPGNFQFMETNGNTYLRIGAKDPLYLGQRVDVSDHRRYILSLDMRSGARKAMLAVFLCEKHLLYSVDCRQINIGLADVGSSWRHFTIPVNSDDIGEPVHGFRRSVELAFNNPVPNTLVDIDNVHLTDAQGRDLLSNGDFSHGHDRWFFTTDDGWPWRVENAWLQVFFEQGLLGLIAFTLLITYVLLSVMKEVKMRRPGATMWLASLVGFLTVGLFGSVLESPRLMLLYYWVIFMVISTTRTGVPWILQTTKPDHKRVDG